MKLHLGCGDIRIPDYINIDFNLLAKGADVFGDIQNLDSLFINNGEEIKIKDNSIDTIYVCHVIEYFNREEIVDILKNWYKKLKTGGLLRLAVPDFREMVCLYLHDDYPLYNFLGPLYGKWITNLGSIYHKTVYDDESLGKLLEDTGFDIVRAWDWRETDHSDIDDYSQAFLPHMAKNDGTRISLNLEGVK